MPSHPSNEEIEQFLAARLGPAGQQRVVRHLLAGCGPCSRRLVEGAPGRLLDRAGERRRNGERGPSRERTLAAALRQEARRRTDEEKLAHSLALLRESPRGYDGLLRRQLQSLHGRPLIEALLRHGFELRYTDPRGMRWLIYNAVQAAESLRPEELGAGPARDLRARAWAELANAYKVNEEFAEAEAALARARALLRQGSGDLHTLAHCARIEASLRGAQRRLAEARKLYDGAYRLYLRLGDPHLAGYALIAKGVLAEYDDTYPQGAPLFRKGLALVDPDRDPQLVAAGQQGLITALVGSGEHLEAGRLLLKSGLRRGLNLGAHVRWVEGRLLAGLGHTAKAERALKEVQEELRAKSLLNGAALVGLDLLPLLLRQGRYGELRRTAGECYGVFRELGIQHEAAKARPYLQ